MVRVRILKPTSTHMPGNIFDAEDSQAEFLISNGLADEVSNSSVSSPESGSEAGPSPEGEDGSVKLSEEDAMRLEIVCSRLSSVLGVMRSSDESSVDFLERAADDVTSRFTISVDDDEGGEDVEGSEDETEE